MKKIKILLIILAIIILASCSNETPLTIRIIETGEKATVYSDLYVKGDTIIIFYNDHLSEKWEIAEQWMKFSGNTYQSNISLRTYNKAIVL